MLKDATDLAYMAEVLTDSPFLTMILISFSTKGSKEHLKIVLSTVTFIYTVEEELASFISEAPFA
jgi:hypothetical protein